MKNWKTSRICQDFNLFIKQCYLIVWSWKKAQTQNAKDTKINEVKLMLLSKFALCDSKKINIYQKTRKSRAVKYDRLNSYTWKDIDMMMKKYCRNPNAFIQIFTVIIDSLKKS